MSDSSHYSDGLSNEENINSDEEPYRFSNIVDDVPSSPNIPNKNQSADVDNGGVDTDNGGVDVDNGGVDVDNQAVDVDNGINKSILSIDNSNNPMKKSVDTNSPTNSQSSVEDIINTCETEDSVNDKTKKKNTNSYNR